MHEELGARLRAVIARVEALADERPATGSPEWLEQQRIRKRLHDLQRDAAVKFGSLFGGKLTTRFSFEALALGKAREGSRLIFTDSATTDHPFYYRCGGRAAVIAAHLYDPDINHLCKFALENRVLLWLPDFPSWHYPGYTTLAAYLGPVGLADLSPDIAAGLGDQFDPTNVSAEISD
jgi:hypothetical protein